MNVFRRPKSIFSRLAVPVLVVFLFAGIFGMVWLRSRITSMEYRMGTLEREKVEALKQEKALYAEMSSLLSIEQVAKNGMKLEFPDRQRVIYVKRDKGGVPYTASLKTD
ncbi:MAG: hypothetical protein P8Y85_04980 [Nitrospirota bacterium]|jgi:hypothetical protein